jgi:hypothetical protein
MSFSVGRWIRRLNAEAYTARRAAFGARARDVH